MAQLFGKNYQEAGSSSSPLLLRSNGEIKLQWGNKFIDLVKNGKINSEAKDYIFTVNTSDEIKANGIYLVTEDNSIWVNVEGTKAKLSDNDTTYVSFLTEQETTPKQKQQALTNLGLIYKNIDALNKAVGGARTSQHTLGQAADIHTKSNSKESNKQLFELIKQLKLPFDQLINEYNYSWVHVSYSNRNRRQILNIK